MLLLRSEADHDERVTRRHAVLLGDERCRRSVEGGDRHVELAGQRATQGPRHPQQLGALVDVPEHERDLHDGADRMQGELELGDHAEAPAASADRPEQVPVLGLAQAPDLAVRGDDLGGHEVVDAQAVLPGQPAHPTTERQPADTGVAHQPDRECEPVLLGGCDRIYQQRATRHPGPPVLGIHDHGAHLAQVDHQPVVHHRAAGDPVCAAPDGHFEPVLHGEPHGRRHVGCRPAADDHGWSPVDGGVPHPPSLLVLSVVGHQHGAGQLRPQGANVGTGGLRHRHSLGCGRPGSARTRRMDPSTVGAAGVGW